MIKRIYMPALLLAFFLWGCSSKPKPQVKPKAMPASAQTQNGANPAPLAGGQPQAQPRPQEATEIPANEKAPLEETIPAEKNDPAAESTDASALLEEALALCQEAQGAWEEADLDHALSALDEAYSLLLKIEAAPDTLLADEKNDLRLTIAKRIQTIYASRMAPRRENNKTIPVIENRYVLAEIESFKNRERESFEQAYLRSGLYRDMIMEEMRKAGLPEDLGWLPMIESGFKIRALSRARALGLWQFISSTGSLYDLKRDRWVDERMDPLKATQAAVRYLSDLHSMFGDWTTALAAYNCGEYKVQRVINAQKVNYLDNFWDLFAMLPYETARFVPRFIAALSIIKEPAKYGFNLPAPYPPLKSETVAVNSAVKLSALSTALGLDASELAFLNAELRYDATPDYPYQLKVPPGLGEKALQAIQTLPRWIPPEATYTWYKVKKGDTLSTIARRHRTSVASVKRLNGLRSNLIRAGQLLKIPGRGAARDIY